jgi:hypothetical protein
MSQLEVDKIIPQSGTTLTIGDSGDTVNFADGTNLGIDTNTLFIDSTNNRVGIGTTSPDHLLHISASSTNAQLKLQRTGSATASYNISASSDGLAFSNQVAGSEVMRITSTGLGIGTSAPSTSIHINSNTPILTFEETDQSNRKFQIGSFGNAYAIYDATNTQYRYILDNSGNHIFNEGSQDCDFRVESNGNANMLFVDGGNDRVGIGTASPSRTLSVFDSTPIVALYNSTTGTGNSDGFQLQLSSDDGYLWNYESGGNVIFGSGGVERARFESAGNFLVGKSSTSIGAVGGEIRNDGLGAFTRDGSVPIISNRNTSDGDAIIIRKDNSTVGVIGTQKWGIGNSNPQNKLDISATTWDDGLLIKNTGNFNTGIIADANRSGAGGGILNLQGRWNGTEVAGVIFQAGSDTTNKDDGEIVFRTASAGTPTERVKIHNNGVMSAVNGIALGVGNANTASNVLDDYEEGTFTPSISGNLGSGSGVNFSIRNAFYTKVGRAVFFNIHISLSSWSSGPSGSSTIITGLPFANENTTGNNASVYIGQCNNFSTSLAPQGGYIQPNETRIILMSNDSSDARNNLNTSIHTNTLTGNEEIRISGYYHTA